MKCQGQNCSSRRCFRACLEFGVHWYHLLWHLFESFDLNQISEIRFSLYTGIVYYRQWKTVGMHLYEVFIVRLPILGNIVEIFLKSDWKQIYSASTDTLGKTNIYFFWPRNMKQNSCHWLNKHKIPIQVVEILVCRPPMNKKQKKKNILNHHFLLSCAH